MRLRCWKKGGLCYKRLTYDTLCHILLQRNNTLSFSNISVSRKLLVGLSLLGCDVNTKLSGKHPTTVNERRRALSWHKYPHLTQNNTSVRTKRGGNTTTLWIIHATSDSMGSLVRYLWSDDESTYCCAFSLGFMVAAQQKNSFNNLCFVSAFVPSSV